MDDDRKAPVRRRRRSFLGTLFMLIGIAAVLILLARHVVVPILVLLPAWMGGAVS